MVTRWLHLPERKKNNKGSMLIMVIMIVAIIGILVTILYGMSLLNFQMKYTDETAKNTFYDAESALDEVRAGLQVEVSDAITNAYIRTMESYSQLTEEERDTQFKSEYVRNLREAIRETGDSSKYSTHHLSGYLVKTRYDESTEIGARISSSNNVLRITEQGIILEDVEVTYYGVQDYVSYIKTDIVLNFPEIDFTQAASIPKLTTYSMIANTQFSATGTKADVEGNVYWGKSGSNGGTVIDNSDITLKQSADSTTKASLITGGDINISNKASFNAENVELWADNIELAGSDLDISGVSYLKDDLVVANNKGVDGARIPSDLKISGDYYGYGSPATAVLAESVQEADIEASPADYSSAILVNGAHTKVDLSGLDALMLAGSSYIQTTGQSGANVSGITNKDTAMGESLAIKSSQTAYLVPTSCVAPESENGGTNPMPATQYNKLVQEMGKDKLVDFNTVVPEYGDSLSSMGVNSYQPAYYRLNNNVSMVYLFMKFDTQADANNFFERYYSIAKNRSTLDGKLDAYTSQLKLPDLDTMADNTRFYYNGNILVNDGSTDSFYINKLQSVTSEEQSYLAATQAEYQDSFTALNKKLIRDYTQLSAEEKSNDVYGNLVNGFSSADNKYNIPAGSKKVFISSGTENYAAVVVNDNYTITSNKISGTDMEGNTITNAELNVVISSGNVIVQSDFEGLIIAKGTITIKNRDDGSSSYQLKSSPTKTAIALSAANQEGVTAAKYLKGDVALINGVNDDEEGSEIKISDLITYDNWQKN